MVCRRHVATIWVVCLLGNAFCVPTGARRTRGYAVNDIDFSKETTEQKKNNEPLSTTSEAAPLSSSSATELDPFSDDDDDDEVFSEPMQTSPTGGSNILSLLRLASALLPSASASGNAPFLRNVIREILGPIGYYNQGSLFLRRSAIDNEIEREDILGLKPPPFQRQELDENSESSDSEDSNGDDDDSNGDDDGNNGAEESLENENEGNDKASEQDDDDYSVEPPEGDGQGGGILGILASLSGGEDGESDLGSLLATVGGIVANLSGDGIDLNALIASGLGLFVGLLSEGDENPGAILASYLLTSLDTITGGGAKNNGAFFGNLLSKLVKGTSAPQDRNDQQSQPSSSPIWTLKMDILRAFLQFGTVVLGQASAGSTNAITV